jgi:AraC family transcriptional regulator
MSSIASIFQAVEFIEANLKEAIRVSDIAEAVSYSLYHFCRMFNRVVHHTPYDYLVRRRLSEAALELTRTGKKVIDIASDYQFSSPETFSRAFKRMLGVQPTQWKRQGGADRRSLMSRLTLAHLEHINRGRYLQPALEEKRDLHFAGVGALVKDDQTVVSELWELLCQELSSSEIAVGAAEYYGIASYPKDWEERGVLYLAAIELGSLEIASPFLVRKSIPAQRYARFVHKGPRQDLGLTLDYVYQTWLPKSGNQLSYPLELEYYGHGLGGETSHESETAILIPIE